MKNAIARMVPRLITILLLATTLAFFFLWLSARRENDGLVRRIDDTRVDDLLARLCVPSEAIHGEWRLWLEVAKLRSKWCEEHSVERFLPYDDVLAIAREGLPSPAAYSTGPDMSSFCPVGRPDLLYEGSYERHWLQTARRAASDLAVAFEENTDLAQLLRERPAVMEKRVVPLLKRLLDIYGPHGRSAACHALLALGDRSEELTDTLLSILKQPMVATSSGRVEYRDFPLAIKDAARLVKKYGLQINVDVDGILRDRKPPGLEN